MMISVAGGLILLSFLAGKGHLWGFILGMILYTLDTMILLLTGYWIGVVFHLFVLWQIYHGFRAKMRLNALKDTGEVIPSSGDYFYYHQASNGHQWYNVRDILCHDVLDPYLHPPGDHHHLRFPALQPDARTMGDPPSLPG